MMKWLFGLACVCLLVVAYIYLAQGSSSQYSNDGVVETVTAVVAEISDTTTQHVETPQQVRALYMTSCVAATPSLRDALVDVVLQREFNSIIIDVKDYSGALSYDPEDDRLDHAWEASDCPVRDMREFIELLHEHGVYVIARVTVFQDPHMANRRPDLAVQYKSSGDVWVDQKGLSFTDVSAREIWDYHVAIAKNAYDAGFDEINFDYVRFPSDGDFSDVHFPHSGATPKEVALERFFAYLHEALDGVDVVTSADIFGMTTTSYHDMNIGQILERALPYFDYIAPMVYPSHYPPGFNGWSNPNDYPYALIKYVMEEAVYRAETPTTTIPAFTHTKVQPPPDDPATPDIDESDVPVVYEKSVYSRDVLRTWIQDFDYGGDYGPLEVRAQIDGSYDAGVESWMVWSPSNRYTESAFLDGRVDETHIGE